MKSLYKKIRGFTFIEMLIVIAILGITLPALFSIIYVILKQQSRVYRLSEVKRQGDYALNIMENTIRNNAKAAYTDGTLTTQMCDVAGATNTKPYFQDKYTTTTWFRYLLSSNKIASVSSKPYPNADSDLTSDTVLALPLNGNGLVSCERSGDYAPLSAKIQFTICYPDKVTGDCPTNPEDLVSLDFVTRVSLRNY